MSTRIAVAIVHGVGKQDGHFHQPMADDLRKRFADHVKRATDDPDAQLVIEPVYWAPAIQPAEDELWRRAKLGGKMDWVKLRRYMIDFAGDAIAYQPTPGERDVYDAVHKILARALRKLADQGCADAPLCVIAHSLGTVIASNYIYDLQAGKPPKTVREVAGDTALEAGRTLTLLYTLGSPIAIWSLRYREFGRPIQVPPSNYDPRLAELAGQCEWVNFYDKDDVIGYPLKTLNDAYALAVTRDVQVNIGGLFASWTPTSHTHYATDSNVTKPIAQSLAKLWHAANDIRQDAPP